MPKKHECNIWCRVHVDANYGNHEQYPVQRFFRTSNASTPWKAVTVHIGPGAFFPYRPTRDQWEGMKRVCPHDQMRLDCNNCLRHTLRPYQIGHR